MSLRWLASSTLVAFLLLSAQPLHAQTCNDDLFAITGPYDPATDTIGDYVFERGKKLQSNDCSYYLVYQNDGNLVIYNANDQAVHSLAYLGLDVNSITGIRFLEGRRLVTMNGEQEGWSNGDATQGGPYYLALVNGVLRIGAIDGDRPSVIWSSQGRR